MSLLFAIAAFVLSRSRLPIFDDFISGLFVGRSFGTFRLAERFKTRQRFTVRGDAIAQIRRLVATFHEAASLQHIHCVLDFVGCVGRLPVMREHVQRPPAAVLAQPQP